VTQQEVGNLEDSLQHCLYIPQNPLISEAFKSLREAVDRSFGPSFATAHRPILMGKKHANVYPDAVQQLSMIPHFYRRCANDMPAFSVNASAAINRKPPQLLQKRKLCARDKIWQEHAGTWQVQNLHKRVRIKT
jgi:hypothetical protein